MQMTSPSGIPLQRKDYDPQPKWDHSNSWGRPFIAVGLLGKNERFDTYKEASEWLWDNRMPGIVAEVAGEYAIGHSIMPKEAQCTQ